jgi:RNA polymerase sigma-70 factor (ECF subfamily)
MKNDIILIVEPLIPHLRRYARTLMRDPAGADDLVQDCLEHMISRWHQRRADGDARAWAFTILHNLAVNAMRQRSRRGQHTPIEDADESRFAQGPSQQEGLYNRDLLKGLKALSEEHRSVLLLVSVEDLSYADAASVLNIPIGTVMSRLARAREKLSAWMEGAATGTGVPSSGKANLRRIK